MDIRHHIYEMQGPGDTTETEIEATATLTREDFDRIAANLRHLAANTYNAEAAERITGADQPGA